MVVLDQSEVFFVLLRSLDYIYLVSLIDLFIIQFLERENNILGVMDHQLDLLEGDLVKSSYLRSGDVRFYVELYTDLRASQYQSNIFSSLGGSLESLHLFSSGEMYFQLQLYSGISSFWWDPSNLWEIDWEVSW